MLINRTQSHSQLAESLLINRTQSHSQLAESTYPIKPLLAKRSQPTKLHRLERTQERLIRVRARPLVDSTWVHKLLAQAAQRAIGALRQEHGLPDGWARDLTGAAIPQAGHRAQHGGLACARVAHDEQMVARMHVDRHVGEELASAVGGEKAQVTHLMREAISGAISGNQGAREGRWER